MFDWIVGRKPKPWPELPLEEIRKRARILVIDDSDFFYLELFQKDGYTVQKWDDVEDLQKLESGYYDVIFLDIQGVGKQQSADQGLGIIRHLKSVRPTQIIVAYSNADWPLKYKEFFDLADASLDKRGDYVDFKKVLDGLLLARFSLGFYLDAVERVAASSRAPKDIRGSAERAILQRDVKVFELALGNSGLDPGRAALALQIVEIAIGVAELFK